MSHARLDLNRSGWIEEEDLAEAASDLGWKVVLGFRVSGLGFRVWGLGFRDVWGLGFRV